jgi:hypothetical protein
MKRATDCTIPHDPSLMLAYEATGITGVGKGMGVGRITGGDGVSGTTVGIGCGF